MTPRQQALYWREWARLRDMLITRGKCQGQIEDYRHELTRRALGVAKSSKAFTNSDLDKVLARLRAECDPANLEAQLDLQESPERRRAYLLARCDEVCGLMWSRGGDDRLTHEEARQGYIRGTARKVCGHELEACTDAEIAKVLGCLEARLKRLRAQVAERAAAAGWQGGEIDGSGNPF
jgi:hypothetical protein